MTTTHISQTLYKEIRDANNAKRDANKTFIIRPLTAKGAVGKAEIARCFTQEEADRRLAEISNLNPGRRYIIAP